MSKKKKIDRNDKSIDVLQSMSQHGCVSSFEAIYRQCVYTKEHYSSPKYEKILVNWGDTLLIYGVLTKEATAQSIEDEERKELDQLSKLFDPMYNAKPKESVESTETEEPPKKKSWSDRVSDLFGGKKKKQRNKICL